MTQIGPSLETRSTSSTQHGRDSDISSWRKVSEKGTRERSSCPNDSWIRKASSEATSSTPSCWYTVTGEGVVLGAIWRNHPCSSQSRSCCTHKTSCPVWTSLARRSCPRGIWRIGSYHTRRASSSECESGGSHAMGDEADMMALAGLARQADKGSRIGQSENTLLSYVSRVTQM
ncbi:hypothetical protein BD311DRAFT_83788 [Dichomitus squalens]|uniref:Uncharacterized protein n=1 Tax=Dichomitus squalens TaxID=114155 RepID=A0A4Q9MBT8_9APHY|nr:hypothetical protein BD311DRAFT_83788 [Dichomitus squalens]